MCYSYIPLIFLASQQDMLSIVYELYTCSMYLYCRPTAWVYTTKSDNNCSLQYTVDHVVQPHVLLQLRTHTSYFPLCMVITFHALCFLLRCTNNVLGQGGDKAELFVVLPPLTGRLGGSHWLPLEVTIGLKCTIQTDCSHECVSY